MRQSSQSQAKFLPTARSISILVLLAVGLLLFALNSKLFSADPRETTDAAAVEIGLARTTAPATLPPIPIGMPSYFNLGLFNASIGDVPPSIPWDFRYQYLAGGANTGSGWATWNNPPGQYALNYIQDARSHGMIPAFEYYQILQSAPYYDEYQNMQNPSTMYAYFDDFKLLMTKCAQAGGSGVVVVTLEADLTGVMQQHSTNDDASTVPASVASSGHPDAAGYPNNFKGMYQAMLHIRNLYAPSVLLTIDVSAWGEGDDVGLALRDNPSYNWQLHADRTAAFLNSTESGFAQHGFDLLSWDPLDRDSAWYQSQGSNRWWDYNNVTQPTFNTMGAWIGRIVQDTSKRVVLWQVPNGNRVYRSENNTDGHWQDNRAEYFLNPTTGRGHMQEWANLGVVGIWWGAGVGSQTHYYDARGDGITNPPPINGNTEVALYADDDGGYIRLQSSAYYSSGTLPLPGGNPPTPVPTVTPGPCGIHFVDVNPSDYFYNGVVYLYCRNVISGYPDNTFRPYNTNTRAQLAKMIVLVENWTLSNPSNNTFADVAPGSTFYQYVETSTQHGILSGYPCGGPGEACDAQHRPYFRPNYNVTRGQVAKIIVLAQGWQLSNPPTNTFADVPPGSTFYQYVETSTQHGILSGYACGGVGEPCDAQHRPYFRPNSVATRGQVAKIINLAMTGP